MTELLSRKCGLFTLIIFNLKLRNAQTVDYQIQQSIVLYIEINEN